MASAMCEDTSDSDEAENQEPKIIEPVRRLVAGLVVEGSNPAVKNPDLKTGHTSNGPDTDSSVKKKPPDPKAKNKEPKPNVPKSTKPTKEVPATQPKMRSTPLAGDPIETTSVGALASMLRQTMPTPWVIKASLAELQVIYPRTANEPGCFLVISSPTILKLYIDDQLLGPTHHFWRLIEEDRLVRGELRITYILEVLHTLMQKGYHTMSDWTQEINRDAKVTKASAGVSQRDQSKGQQGTAELNRNPKPTSSQSARHSSKLTAAQRNLERRRRRCHCKETPPDDLGVLEDSKPEVGAKNRTDDFKKFVTKVGATTRRATNANKAAEGGKQVATSANGRSAKNAKVQEAPDDKNSVLSRISSRMFKAQLAALMMMEEAPESETPIAPWANPINMENVAKAQEAARKMRAKHSQVSVPIHVPFVADGGKTRIFVATILSRTGAEITLREVLHAMNQNRSLLDEDVFGREFKFVRCNWTEILELLSERVTCEHTSEQPELLRTHYERTFSILDKWVEIVENNRDVLASIPVPEIKWQPEVYSDDDLLYDEVLNNFRKIRILRLYINTCCTIFWHALTSISPTFKKIPR